MPQDVSRGLRRTPVRLGTSSRGQRAPHHGTPPRPRLAARFPGRAVLGAPDALPRGCPTSTSAARCAGAVRHPQRQRNGRVAGVPGCCDGDMPRSRCPRRRHHADGKHVRDDLGDAVPGRRAHRRRRRSEQLGTISRRRRGREARREAVEQLRPVAIIASSVGPPLQDDDAPQHPLQRHPGGAREGHP